MRGLKTRFRQRVAVVAAATAIAGVGSLVSAGLLPGGGPKNSDCYVELSVQNVDSPGPDVKGNRTVRCVEGEACDSDGACGNGSCTFKVAVCIDQQDPNLPQCTPAGSLRKPPKVNSKIAGAVPASLTGSACGSFVGDPGTTLSLGYQDLAASARRSNASRSCWARWSDDY